MCTCSPDKECTEEYFSAKSELQPSSQQTSWRTPVDRSIQSEYCSPECPAPSTPKSQQIPPQVPMAPLRTLRRRPELAAGVAIAARRIDFDRMELTSSDLEETPDDIFDESDLSGRPLAASSFRSSPPSAASARQTTPGTYRLRRARPPQPPRQYAPRMTQMTPCGKCLRM